MELEKEKLKNLNLLLKLNESKDLLKKCLRMLNLIPNKSAKGGLDHYNLCGKIEEFLNTK